LAAFFSYWIIQDFPDTAKFLSEEERMSDRANFRIPIANSKISGVFIIRRLQDDMQLSAAGETLKIKYVWKSLTDWKTWIASMTVRSLVAMLTLKYPSVYQWEYTWVCTYHIAMEQLPSS